MDHPHKRRRLLARQSTIPRPALFLDRDGVVIEDCHHLSNPNQVTLLPGARELLRHANATGWPVVLITNQSGIARGLFDWDAYELVTDRLLELLGPDAPIAAIYANGHGPDAPATSWRKPSPAMLLAAGQELNLDLGGSLLIGDRLSDLQAGAAAGLAWLGHVLSGHGQHERPRVAAHIGPTGLFKGENPSSWQTQVVLLESLFDFPPSLLGTQVLQPR
jgi:D-glycero-D-manno-heptose 1,7-bisphosphate phosphatase